MYPQRMRGAQIAMIALVTASIAAVCAVLFSAFLDRRVRARAAVALARTRSALDACEDFRAPSARPIATACDALVERIAGGDSRDREELDVSGCRRTLTDRLVLAFNREIAVLRCLEYARARDRPTRAQWRRARPIVARLYDVLARVNRLKGARVNLQFSRPFTRELYERLVYYYALFNRNVALRPRAAPRAPVRVFSYVQNHQCLVPLVRDGLRRSMIHFDTHDDMSPLQNFTALAAALGETPPCMPRVMSALHDIACFSTAYTFYARKNFVWVKPAWTAAADADDDADDGDDDEGEDDWRAWVRVRATRRTRAGKADTGREIEHFVTPSRARKRGCWASASCTDGAAHERRAFALLEPGYVLSLDLDYICSNGRDAKDQKSARIDDNDPASPIRARECEPRDVYDPFDNEIPDKDETVWRRGTRPVDVHNAMRNELAAVRERVAAFERMVERLVAVAGYPSAVVISDSANVVFSSLSDHATLLNNFLPSYYALYLRRLVFGALHRAFDTLDVARESAHPELPSARSCRHAADSPILPSVGACLNNRAGCPHCARARNWRRLVRGQ